jgi:hypothetical protein
MSDEKRAGVSSQPMEEGERRGRPSLVFVYNAESGVFNALADSAHKIFSPATYACNLCALTHSAFGMRAGWRRFLESLGVSLEFLHADELRSRYPSESSPLPAVFVKEGGACSRVPTPSTPAARRTT